MKKLIPAVLLLTAYFTANTQTQTLQETPDAYLVHHFNIGERFGTVFSRTITITGDGFTTNVARISGTGDYTVTGNNAQQTDFAVVFLIDGRPEDKCSIVLKDSGKTLVYNGKPFTNTDASGLSYNPLLWGMPQAKLTKGMVWEIDIKQPWELGGPGRQRVEVLETDAAGRQVTLKREGDGDGAFFGDRREADIVKDGKTIRMQITSGKSHWTGYTIFKNGIVISDELMVTRPLTLQTDSLRLPATQRQYILLNQRPQ
ncbi:hypothetical protein [Deminuibacter soli]|nr:hypothetical protein [Deminuibacter soli]